MTEFKRLMKNRFVIGVFFTAFLLVTLSLLTILLSTEGKPGQFFPFASVSHESLNRDEAIRGSVEFDKSSYLIGELARYEIKLLWDSDKLTPDIETFKDGIGFFPFDQRANKEQWRVLEDGINEYILEVTLQAVDVEPASSYVLAPPTIYYTADGDSNRELKAYRFNAPQVFIGSYYPPNVSKIPLGRLKGEIDDPILLRQGIIVFLSCLLVCLSMLMLWYFGRVRRIETLSQAEKLWREFYQLKKESMGSRDYLVRCELIFTNLLMSRIEMSPIVFWAGKEPDDILWKNNVNQAREIFYKSYFPENPDNSDIERINDLLNGLFSQLVEEERLQTEQVPSFLSRLTQQPAILSISGALIICAGVLFSIAIRPLTWISNDIAEYNQTIKFLEGNDSIENKYEQVSNLAERVNDKKIKAAALYNAGIFSTVAGLTAQDDYQQEALLEVMFQEQKDFLDALLHSMDMEDPFLLVAIIRDSIRFMTQGLAALKAAARIMPNDETIHRNLELMHKRRQAYVETILELLREDANDSGLGQLQRQTLIDLEYFMQMEMPEEFAELEEGKDDKDYFILEGF